MIEKRRWWYAGPNRWTLTAPSVWMPIWHAGTDEWGRFVLYLGIGPVTGRLCIATTHCPCDGCCDLREQMAAWEAEDALTFTSSAEAVAWLDSDEPGSKSAGVRRLIGEDL